MEGARARSIAIGTLVAGGGRMSGQGVTSELFVNERSPRMVAKGGADSVDTRPGCDGPFEPEPQYR